MLQKFVSMLFLIVRTCLKPSFPLPFAYTSNTFLDCRTLIEVALPNVLSIDKGAFLACYALRHIKIHPNVNIAKVTFFASLSLEVLATCAGFELNAGDVTPTYGNPDPTVAITSYLKSQCELDRQQRDIFLTYNLLLKLCNYHIDKKTKSSCMAPKGGTARELSLTTRIQPVTSSHSLG